MTFEHKAEVSLLEHASLALEFVGPHRIRMMSVSHRGPHQTTVHFEGDGAPPFNAHGAESREDLRELR